MTTVEILYLDKAYAEVLQKELQGSTYYEFEIELIDAPDLYNWGLEVSTKRPSVKKEDLKETFFMTALDILAEKLIKEKK